MPPDETVWCADPHTVAKQRIYRKYFQAWFPIVQQGFDCGATYAEGFAGPGEYKNGHSGSPLNAVSAALRCARPPSRDRPVGFVFIEARKDRVDHLNGLLRRELNTLDDGSLADRGVRLSVVKGKCEEDLPGALNVQRSWGRPLLVVLDTWGAGVSYRLLKKIGSMRSSEVIVTFEPQHFVRFASHPEHFGDSI
ncbi:MAG: three-Cys-motif partner protein TcmP, partial [Pseudonocardiaceae bacterium]|nr:three-Cys-motif partner protein TcmP [Pseudonocardiaceae bacterium]